MSIYAGVAGEITGPPAAISVPPAVSTFTAQANAVAAAQPVLPHSPQQAARTVTRQRRAKVQYVYEHGTLVYGRKRKEAEFLVDRLRVSKYSSLVGKGRPFIHVVGDELDDNPEIQTLFRQIDRMQIVYFMLRTLLTKETTSAE